MTELRYVFLLLALCPLFAAGCQQANSLEGAITYNGQPVEQGSISFRPAEGTGGSGFGAEIVGGKFKTDKVKLGKHVVLVRGLDTKVVPQSTEEAIKQYEAAKAAGKAVLDHYGQPADYIPENAEGNSQTVDIGAGAQTLDFALKGPPRGK